MSIIKPIPRERVRLDGLPPGTAFTTRASRMPGLVILPPQVEGEGVLVELPTPGGVGGQTYLKRVHPGCLVDAEEE